ncbi:MAG: M14 family zinc carboxypeptidase [Beijerinckiaceae bacterium]
MLAGCVGCGAALAQTSVPHSEIISTTGVYRQSPAVQQRYGDVAVSLNSPFFLDRKTDFTDHEAMMSFVQKLALGSGGRAALLSAGQSQQGRDIPLLLFTAEGDRTLEAAAQRKERPVIWFMGLQHGNEPAGGEGLLALAAELAQPDAKDMLSKVTIVIAPRVNPDGAQRFLRNTANGADPNRDHLLLFLPETQGVHRSMRLLQPDVVFDHHEFSVANRWIEKYGMIQSVDALFLHATNPLVPKGISSLAEKLYRPAVDSELAKHGLTSFWYYTTSTRRSEKTVSMGGNNPGIGRNAMGLGGAVSFLIESRGVGIGMEGWQRRVATHVLAGRAVIAATLKEADSLKIALASERQAAAAATDDLIIASRIPANPLDIPMIDPKTAELQLVSVPFQDSRVIEPTQVRPRAAGYLLTGATEAAIERFRLQGVAVCQLAAGVRLSVEAYALTAVAATAGRENINPDQTLRAVIVDREMVLPAVTLFVPMAQSSAGIIASAMEPDSPGSYLATGVIPLAAGVTEAPIFRVKKGVLPAAAGLTAADQAVCAKP